MSQTRIFLEILWPEFWYGQRSTKQVCSKTYIPQWKKWIFCEVQFPIFHNICFEWAHGHSGDSIQFHFREKKKHKVLNESNSSPNHFPGVSLLLDLSLSLCCCGRRVEENAGNEDCNVTEGILNCFTPSQEPVLLMQWLVKKGTLTLQVDVQLTTSRQRLPLCNC